jgi:predicted glycosyltransferase
MTGEPPIADAERANYFHSLYHANVIVGLNTTALIEAAIFGKPVLSVAAPKQAKYRETLHFGHIEQGLLVVAGDLREHTHQVATALDSHGFSERCRRFVEQFVRPFGWDHPAGDRMADAVEILAASGRRNRS